jgi:hypothetical protein
MNKIHLILFYLCITFSIKGQQKPIENIILYSTSNKNTTLFFSNPIKNGIVGNENFTFGYNKENYGKIGILKSTPGEESNLLVITENGNIFSFIIRYKKDIDKINYFINDSLAIGNESGNVYKESPVKKLNQRVEKIITPKISDVSISEAVTVNSYEKDEEESKDATKLYEKICLGEIDKPIFYNRIYGTKDKITVKLKNIRYLKNELYLTVILKNESTLDYDINYLNFYITSRNKKKNTASQTIPYKSKYIHNLPTKIKAGQNIEVVYVYQKFSINENKILLIEMTEDNGERIVKLEIPNTFINNPN